MLAARPDTMMGRGKVIFSQLNLSLLYIVGDKTLLILYIRGWVNLKTLCH
jgi:hypothetical protein